MVHGHHYARLSSWRNNAATPGSMIKLLLDVKRLFGYVLIPSRLYVMVLVQSYRTRLRVGS
jgi:hypothetical protein